MRTLPSDADEQLPTLANRLALTIPSFAAAFEMKISRVYDLARREKIPFRICGRTPLISVEDALDWYRALP